MSYAQILPLPLPHPRSGGRRKTSQAAPARWWTRFLTRRRHLSDYRYLLGMPDHLLADVGLDRSQLRDAMDWRLR